MYSEIDRLYDPERFELTAARHTKALTWERQGWIPLGIHVVDPECGRGLDYGDWLKPEPFLEIQRKVLADTLAVGSDLLPIAPINHMGDAPITSLFGAEQYVPEDGSATLQDVGPTPLPVFSSIEEVADLDVPPMDAGVMPEIVRMLEVYRAGFPEWVHVLRPMPAGPFSTAMELRGADIIYDMYERPDLCKRLIMISAEAQCLVEFETRRVVGAGCDPRVSNFGIMGAGLRLGDDSFVNLSPDMIREFCLPAFELTNRMCGGSGHIHFCTLPHSRFDFIYPVLAASDQVSVVSSQFGFEYYQDHLAELRGRLAVEAFYGDALADVRARYGSFRAWANDFVPRFKDESGLVLYCQAASVDEGREMWADWAEAHRR